jgi:hypothetical protein
MNELTIDETKERLLFLFSLLKIMNTKIDTASSSVSLELFPDLSGRFRFEFSGHDVSRTGIEKGSEFYKCDDTSFGKHLEDINKTISKLNKVLEIWNK